MRQLRLLFVGLVITVLLILVVTEIATAEEKPPPPSTERSLLLTKGPGTSAVAQGVLTTAELQFESCAITTRGTLEENKQNIDFAKLTEPVASVSGKPNCETSESGGEKIKEVFASTFSGTREESKAKTPPEGEPGENWSLYFVGEMKYRTSSPKCTYLTKEFTGELKIKTFAKTEKPFTSEGTRVPGESEAGCPEHKTVTATGVLYYEKPSEPEKNEYWAIRKFEK